ncbi:cytidine deaminase [Patella vulgata]|uniref:cytidine deaminase n=1 Tax=Patella vulgata TaxID=6465 RepID=UPI0021808046|nr:cytidine deaminase [Patella vulgata]
MDVGKPFSELDSKLQALAEAAISVKAKAYCPYSEFKVGCAVLTENGQIFEGCNVENASYGLSICAERVALVKAVSEGHLKFQALAVVCEVKDSFKGSCGACRQFMAEFGLNWDVYLIKPDRTWMKVTVKELYPLAFCPDALKEQRI